MQRQVVHADAVQVETLEAKCGVRNAPEVSKTLIVVTIITTIIILIEMTYSIYIKMQYDN